MGRISDYEQDSDLTREDNVSGSDTSGRTSNYSLGSIATFLQGAQGISLNLPTTEPSTPGLLWVDSNGFLKVSS